MRQFLRAGILILGAGILVLLALLGARLAHAPAPVPTAPEADRTPAPPPAAGSPEAAAREPAEQGLRGPGRAPGSPLESAAARSTAPARAVMSEQERSARNEQLIQELEKQKARMGIVRVLPKDEADKKLPPVPPNP